MTSFLNRLALVLCLSCILSACKEPVASVSYTPSDCGYKVPRITFSDPAACTPKLTTFTNPSAQNPIPADRLPALPGDCAVTGPSRIAYLDGIDDGSFFLHVYRAVPGPLSVQVFGEVSCGKVEPVSECLSVDEVAARFEISLSTNYSALYVRVAVDGDYVEQFSASNFVSLAAYDDTEPRSAGSIRYRAGGEVVKKLDEDQEANLPPLPFSCDGTSFQRVLINACEGDAETIKRWIAELGISPSEQYYGAKGNVVVFDVPPGMDPHTTGGSATELRSGLRGTGNTAEPDYIINLFNPRDPSRIASPSHRIPLATNDRWLNELHDLNKGFFVTLPPFIAPIPSNNQRPRIATIIDSGVDASEPNAANWVPLTYGGRIETEFIKPGQLGFDFIAKDMIPNDVVPHGTYVASSLMGQYTSDENLDLVHMKTFGTEGVSPYFGALVSIYEATAIGSDVINMSWGIDLPKAPEALTCAVETAVNEGIYLFVSVGNDTLDLEARPQWPANYAVQYPERVISTASYWYGGDLENRSDEDVELLYFSNYSEKHASMAGYMTAPVPQVGDGEIIYPLGTSFTTPQVAGSFLNWMAWTGGTSLSDWQSNNYSTGPQVLPYVYRGHYLPAPKRGSQP